MRSILSHQGWMIAAAGLLAATATLAAAPESQDEIATERAAIVRNRALQVLQLEEPSPELSQAELDRLLDEPAAEPEVSEFRGDRAPAIEAWGDEPQGDQAHLYQ